MHDDAGAEDRLREVAKRPHTLSPEQVAQALGVDADLGLSAEEAARRLSLHGPNALPPPHTMRAWRILLDQFRSGVVLLLVFIGVVAFGFGERLEALAIFAVVIVNAGIGFATEMKAVRSMEALRRMVEVPARAWRSGGLVEIPARELVPGDLVFLEAGDLVPADARLAESSRLETNESAFTGESLPVAKSLAVVAEDALVAERTCMLFQGTSVTRGSATGIVVATGGQTQLARLAELAEESAEPPSHLEMRLNRLGQQLVWAMMAIGALVIVIGILRGRPLLIIAETAVALTVAAIPEGLPAVATLALSRGMLIMARHNALVRRLSAVETLGSTNVLCVDKTGTLTENHLSVERIWNTDGAFDTTQTLPGDAAIRVALEVAALCNNASLSETGESTGDPLEVALLHLVAREGIERASLIARGQEERQEPFDPSTKMMATFHRRASTWLVAVKGAPEAVVSASVDVLGREGRRPLDAQERARWMAAATTFATDGYRVLALASRDVAMLDDTPYERLTLVALVAFLDPPRADVAPAIAECQRAGVRVVMVTGDHAGTAAHVARAVGIGEGHDVILGQEIPSGDITASATLSRLAKADIFARVAPEQKVSIVVLHQAAGNVVAMTGDGVNDAPALRRADIGIAMGRRGTQVAREASDVVLRDDAFSTIVLAIRHGRVIFGNIRRFILYLLSCNVSEVLIVALGIGFNAPLALMPLQILFLNLVTDVFPALALGLGRGETNVMDTPPRPPGEPFLRRDHWRAIIGYGALVAAAVLIAFGIALGPMALPASISVTISFLTLGFAQLWHVFNMRSVGSRVAHNEVTRNPFVWGALALCAASLLAAVHVPALAQVLSVERLDLRQWGLVLGMSFVPLLVGQFVATFRSRSASSRRGS